MPDHETTAAAPLQILLVESNPEVNASFSELLASMGHAVTAFVDADAALGHAARQPPDVVFSALVFRWTNGFALCAQLRQLPGMAGSTIVALTGLGFPGIEGIVRQAGFDHYLRKPIDRRMLADIVALLDRVRTRTAPRHTLIHERRS